MRRNKRNLFEILEMRSKRGSDPQPDQSPQAKPRSRVRSGQASRWQDAKSNLLSWWSQWRRSETKVVKSGIGGFGLAAVVLGALGVGFLFGRWLSPSAPVQDQQLRKNQPREPEQPSNLSDPKRTFDLAPAQEIEKLSNLCFVTVIYSASQRREASRLASYLREQGIQTARIRENQTKSGSSVWVVVAYAPAGDDNEALRAQRNLLTKLKQVPAPTFEPNWTVYETPQEFSEH